jgi:hypothetical protein
MWLASGRNFALHATEITIFVSDLFELRKDNFVHCLLQHKWQARALSRSRSSGFSVCPPVFTNRIEDLRLQDLAEVDLRETVFQVQEFFGDFAVLDPHHFAVPILQNHVTLQPFTWDYGRRYAH